MKLMAEVKELEQYLCGLDCGSCGAPSCRALAEDVVKGYATMESCIFVVRDQLQAMASEIEKISHLLPGLGVSNNNK
jgi:Na+-translocating ferredoxin:NAD+ oxidoreductase RNF subunit RnfB